MAEGRSKECSCQSMGDLKAQDVRKLSPDCGTDQFLLDPSRPLGTQDGASASARGSRGRGRQDRYANRGFVKWLPDGCFVKASSFLERGALAVCLVLGPQALTACAGSDPLENTARSAFGPAGVEIGERYESKPSKAPAVASDYFAGPADTPGVTQAARAETRVTRTQVARFHVDRYADTAAEEGVDPRRASSLKAPAAPRRDLAASQGAAVRGDDVSKTTGAVSQQPAPISTSPVAMGEKVSATAAQALALPKLSGSSSHAFSGDARFQSIDDGLASDPGVATTFRGREASFTAKVSGDSQDKTNPWAFGNRQAGANLQGSSAEEWNRRTDINTELKFDDSMSLRLRNSARDQRSLKEETVGSFFLNYSDEWEEKRVNDTQLAAGFFDDRLRFTTAYSMSRFASDDTDGDVEAGSQHQQSVAFEPWRGDDVGVTLFTTYGATEASYKDLSLNSDDKKLQNPFADSSLFADRGFNAVRYGGEARLGPGSLTLSQTQSWAEKDSGHSKNEYQAAVKFDVNDAARRVGYTPEGFADAVLPDSLWFDYGLGRETSDDLDGPDSRSTDMSVGGAWYWGGLYSTASYWTSFLDNVKSGEEDNDWEGQGIDVTLGYATATWGLDGGVGYSGSDNYGEWSRSTETGIEGWLSFSYFPGDDFPPISTTLSANRWQGTYVSDDGESLSDDWSLITEVDFSQYADDWFGWTSKSAGLGLTMGLQGARDTDQWSGVSDGESTLDVFVGFTGKVDFYE